MIFHLYKVGDRKRLSAPFLIGLCFYGGFFLLWSSHMWLNATNSNCYSLLPTFFGFATLMLLQSLQLFQNISQNSYHSNAFPRSHRESYVWNFCYPNHKVWSCSSKTRCSVRILLFTQCPNFTLKPKIIWFIPLLRSTAPQNLMLRLLVNFDTKRFQVFTLFGSPIKTANVELDEILNEVDDANVKEK